MPRCTCAELIALSVLCCMLAMSRSDRRYSSKGVIGEKKSEEDRDGGQNQRRKQKDQYTHVLAVPGTWYFAHNTCYLVVLCLFKRKHRAPLRGRLTPLATLAQGRMQLKYVKGEGRRGPRLFGANSEVIMPRGACAELIALRCAGCLLMPHSERQFV